MSNSRKALRDFYKLPGDSPVIDAGSETSSETNTLSADHASDISRPNTPRDEKYEAMANDPLLEAEEEPLTKLEELDNPDVDIDAFVASLVEKQTLPSFISTVTQIRKEQVSLASAQRELVNDNYKKLIKAADMLGHLNTQGDLASVDTLTQSVSLLSEWANKLPKTV